MNLRAWWRNFIEWHSETLLSNPCDQYGYCMGCHLCKPPHYIDYIDGEEGVFPYCVDCHRQLSIAEKVALVDKLMGLHMKGDPHNHMEIAKHFEIVRASVVDGR